MPAVEIISEPRKTHSAKVVEHIGPNTVRCKVDGRGDPMKVIIPNNLGGRPKIGSELQVDVRKTRKGREHKAYWLPA